jgi:hypothetical protein
VISRTTSPSVVAALLLAAAAPAFAAVPPPDDPPITSPAPRRVRAPQAAPRIDRRTDPLKMERRVGAPAEPSRRNELEDLRRKDVAAGLARPGVPVELG